MTIKEKDYLGMIRWKNILDHDLQKTSKELSRIKKEFEKKALQVNILNITILEREQAIRKLQKEFGEAILEKE